MSEARRKTQRQEAQRRGARAETLALWWLRAKGYRLLARNYRRGVGEADLVMARGKLLIFVEVKRREDKAAAGEAIQPRQQARIARAAEAFIAQHKKHWGKDIRFDAVLISPRALPRHIEDAWR
jgi:putative endonuclease